MRWVWREEATEAVIEFLEDTLVGSRSSGMARAKVDDRERECVCYQLFISRYIHAA